MASMHHQPAASKRLRMANTSTSTSGAGERDLGRPFDVIETSLDEEVDQEEAAGGKSSKDLLADLTDVIGGGAVPRAASNGAAAKKSSSKHASRPARRPIKLEGGDGKRGGDTEDADNLSDDTEGDEQEEDEDDETEGEEPVEEDEDDDDDDDDDDGDDGDADHVPDDDDDEEDDDDDDEDGDAFANGKNKKGSSSKKQKQQQQQQRKRHKPAAASQANTSNLNSSTNNSRNSTGGGHSSLQRQLAASGPAGVAAAAAIATVRKRRRPHTFETNPSVRKRQQTRLIRKLRACIDEYTARVGQQAVVLITMPGKTAHNFKVFGAQPLESVVRSCKGEIMAELEQAVLEQTPLRHGREAHDSNKHELPPLVIDGIPTPVEKMTQAQLRAFIPLMLKYSTGRGKPGWGKDSTRPAWWPTTLPWANVRSDARDDASKQCISWTTTLREIVTNCYKFHGREDLLPIFDEENDERPEDPDEMPVGNKQTTSNGSGQKAPQAAAGNSASGGNNRSLRPLGSASTRSRQQQQAAQQQQHQQQQQAIYQQVAFEATPGGQAGGNFMQTIQNADGSVSLIQVDPANAQILTLPDGTQVRAVRLQTMPATSTGSGGGGGSNDDQQLIQGASGELHTLIETQHHHHQFQQQQHDLQHAQLIDAASGQQAELNSEGQIILTSEDGTQSCYPMSQLVSIPASVYQQFAASGQPLQIISADGTQLTTANAIQLHTIEEAQEISASDAGAASSGNVDQLQQVVMETSGGDGVDETAAVAQPEREVRDTQKASGGGRRETSSGERRTNRFFSSHNSSN